MGKRKHVHRHINLEPTKKGMHVMQVEKERGRGKTMRV